MACAKRRQAQSGGRLLVAGLELFGLAPGERLLEPTQSGAHDSADRPLGGVSLARQPPAKAEERF